MIGTSRKEQCVLLYYLITDVLLYYLALMAASMTRAHTLYQIDYATLQRDRLMCVGVFVVASMMTGCYKTARITDRFDAIYFSLIALFATGVTQFILVALLGKEPLAISRREVAFGIFIGAGAIVVWHFWAASLLSRFEPLHRFFYVLGDPDQCKRLCADLQKNTAIKTVSQYLTLEKLCQKKPYTDARRTRDAIISVTQQNREQLLTLLEEAKKRCRRIYLHPTLSDALLMYHTPLAEVAGVPLIEVGNREGSPYAMLKRLIDYTVATLGLILASPICVLTAVAIKLTSRGPVFYRQERMGRTGTVFNLYKFRSMVVDAESATGPVWADSHDRRVTAVGRFIRKHRIDEIPQFINVLKGDMSLVGPRPERPHFHKEFCQSWPLFDMRLDVRPGVTSLSHVLGSYASAPSDRLRYDLIYIGSVSFFMDMRILVATLRVVLGAKGAQ